MIVQNKGGAKAPVENPNDDDVSYFEFKPEHMVQMPPQEKVWAQIGDDLKLAYIDWDIITAMANQFDENHRQGKPKTQSEVMSKLLLLVRDETRKEFGA